MRYIIILGNPVDGFTYIGPFEDMEALNEHADTIMGEWWAAGLEAPEVVEVEPDPE